METSTINTKEVFMRLKDRKAIWLKKLRLMNHIEIATELSKLERELERKNEDVGFIGKIHSRTEEDSRRYHNRKINELTLLVREREKTIEMLRAILDDQD